MSLADELLDRLTENQTETRAIDQTDKPHIVIYPNRDVFVPEELKEIAVQHENNIKTVTFDCPRYWDGHDLTELTIYINYERSDKEKGRYPVANVRVDESDESLIHFDWTISGHVTETFGDLTILACAKSVDDQGYEKEHWNSHRYEEMTVAEGLECADDIPEMYPDEIAVILGRIDELTKHTHTAQDVGAIPAGGDSNSTVAFKRVVIKEVVANDSVELHSTTTSSVYLRNSTSEGDKPTLALEGDDGPDSGPVIIHNVAEPETDNQASNKKYVDTSLQNLRKNVYDKDTVDHKLQNLDKYATTQYVDNTVGAINAILATLSDGGESGGVE